MRKQNKPEKIPWHGQWATRKVLSDGEEDENIDREIKFLTHLSDRYIIQLYAEEECPRAIIMEYAEQGDLQSALPTLEWYDRERITGEIAQGLSYMHGVGVIHCDIKTENILLTRRLEVRICDFGSAKWITDIDCCVGTDGWMAPELVQDRTKYTPQSDVYALGLIMWAMAVISKKDPSLATGTVLNQYVRSPGKSNALDHVPLKYLRTMQDCCNPEPKRRPAASKLSSMKYGPYLIPPNSLVQQLASEGDIKMQEELIRRAIPDMGSATRLEGLNLLRRGACYFSGAKVPKDAKDVAKEMALYREAAALECENEADAALGWMSIKLKDFKTGMDCAQRISNTPHGSYLLGEIYEYGYGVEENKGEAHRCFYMAAQKFHEKAAVRMASHSYLEGNYEKALTWLRMANDLKMPQAKRILGQMYYYGRGVDQDKARGESLFNEAAKEGDIEAIVMVGWVHIQRKRYKRAMKLLLRAEDSSNAQNLIGHMHFSGRGVLPNASLAKQWFQKAADQDHSDALFSLARMHQVGFGAKVDVAGAIEYFEKAAELGHKEAQFELAQCLLGSGHKTDLGMGVLHEIMPNNVEAEARMIFNAMDDLSDSE